MNRKNTYWNFFDAYVDLKKDDYILIFQKKCGFSQYFDGSGIKGKKLLFSILCHVRPTDDFFTIFFNFGFVYIQI